jgi:hypothetical protein
MSLDSEETSEMTFPQRMGPKPVEAEMQMDTMDDDLN